MQKIKDFIKSKLGTGIIVGVLSFSLGGIIATDVETPKLLEEVTAKAENLEKANTTLKDENNKLEAKVKEAQPWFDMKEEDRKAEEKRIAEEKAKADAEQKAKEEAEKAEKDRIAKEEEAKAANKIGERIVFSYGSEGEFALTINSVSLTSERNQFSDPVTNVVEINYTVENISMEELDFFMTNQAKFYDANGTKCSDYPNSSGPGTYDIGKGRNATGKEFIGISSTDVPYLEMELGGTTYKWSL